MEAGPNNNGALIAYCCPTFALANIFMPDILDVVEFNLVHTPQTAVEETGVNVYAYRLVALYVVLTYV